MPSATSSDAYKWEEAQFARALETEKDSVLILFPSGPEGAPKATKLVHRFNSFRKVLRRLNAEVYPEGDPMHNRCLYDCIEISKYYDEAEDRHGVKLTNGSSFASEVEVTEV